MPGVISVKKAEVDVEVDVRKIVLVIELQPRDLHRCLQKKTWYCSKCIEQLLAGPFYF